MTIDVTNARRAFLRERYRNLFFFSFVFAALYLLFLCLSLSHGVPVRNLILQTKSLSLEYKCIWRISNFAYTIFNANTFNFNLNLNGWCVCVCECIWFWPCNNRQWHLWVPHFSSCVRWQGCFSSGLWFTIYSFHCSFVYWICFNSLLHGFDLTMKAAPTNYILATAIGHIQHTRALRKVQKKKKNGIKDDFHYVSPQINTCTINT